MIMRIVVLLSWFLIMTSMFNELCSSAQNHRRRYSNPITVSQKKCLQYQAIRMKEIRRRFSVIHGKATKAGEYPHMAALGWKSISEKALKFMCGATLISDFFLLTAAHCIISAKIRDFETPYPTIVRLGSRNIKFSKMEIPIDYHIVKRIPHPKYHTKSNSYDIGLIKTGQQIKFRKYVHPACLPLSNSYPGEQKYTVTGWEKYSVRSQSMSDDLRYGEVDLFEKRYCTYLLTAYMSRNWKKLSNDHICAGKLDGSIDTCEGDSGGPLQYKMDKYGGMHTIVGVTIYGSSRCARKNLPSLYSNVYYFLPWITKNVWPEE